MAPSTFLSFKIILLGLCPAEIVLAVDHLMMAIDCWRQVFVPVVKDEVRNAEGFELRSLGPYRLLELAVILTAGW